MIGELDMGNQKIKNLTTPGSSENDAVEKFEVLNREVNVSHTNLLTQLTTNYKNTFNDSHVNPALNLINVLAYLMVGILMILPVKHKYIN